MTPPKRTTLFLLVVTGMCIAGIGLIMYLRSLERDISGDQVDKATPGATTDQANKQTDYTPKQTNDSVAPNANAGAVTETSPERNNTGAAIAATVGGILMAFVLLVIIKTRQRKAMRGQGASQPKPSIQPETAPPAPELNLLQSGSQEALSIQPKTTAPPESPATTEAPKPLLERKGGNLWQLAMSRAKLELGQPEDLIVKVPRNVKYYKGRKEQKVEPEDIGVRVYMRAEQIFQDLKAEELKLKATEKKAAKDVKFLKDDVVKALVKAPITEEEFEASFGEREISKVENENEFAETESLLPEEPLYNGKMGKTLAISRV